eukprot:6659457-Ditylum_brightwellii.AAC.2
MVLGAESSMAPDIVASILLGANHDIVPGIVTGIALGSNCDMMLGTDYNMVLGIVVGIAPDAIFIPSQLWLYQQHSLGQRKRCGWPLS